MTTGSRGVRISGSNAGYTMFRGSVNSTGYPLHSPVSPSLTPLVRHHVPPHFNWTLPLVPLFIILLWCGVRLHLCTAVASNGPNDHSLDSGWKNVFWNCGGMILIGEKPVQMPLSPPQTHVGCPGIEPSSLW